ncbi:DUF5689 domain-containing protein [Polaribacter tangerinus]|uniref:DUF5689 domain-containing protein n=1 Tax=Polaribacter tangerinus TaxID=1920034 RepID=UPI000B4B2321|nr:DUF5689 domain-containing protein [Polaribacter tangerinus]
MNLKSNIIGIIGSISLIIGGCVNDNDFSVPENLGAEENTKQLLLLDSITSNLLELKSISDLKKLYVSGSNPLKIVSNIVIKGYVISSDAKGNYFREFYMQDSPENPTSGIKIAINLTSSYNKYNVGREVYIRLKGLYLGEINSGDGVFTIGGSLKLTNVKEVESISQNQLKNHVFRAPNTAIIVPKKIPFGDLDNTANIGIFVQLENTSFAKNLKGKTFVDPLEDFDTKRTIVTCLGPSFATSFIETSAFANFANNALPTGSGTINAVVSRDYAGKFTVLVLNEVEDIEMNNQHCIPSNLSDFPLILLKQDFENTTRIIQIPDWTNFVEKGSKPWRAYDDANSLSRAARVNSFRSGDDHTVSWLITKAINVNNTTEEYLSFETSTSFADASILEVLISEDWKGDTSKINEANWQKLPARIAGNNDDFNIFKHSTFINLSLYSGTVYIAFKYSGNEKEDFDGTYEVDNIVIHAK